MDESDEYSKKILLLQRLTRSFYVRRQIEQVRKDYLRTLSEIEGLPCVENIQGIKPIVNSKSTNDDRTTTTTAVERSLVGNQKPTDSNRTTASTTPVPEHFDDQTQSNERISSPLKHLTRDDLLRKREEIAMELLWIEQAIQSRKDYLRLKSRYTGSIS